MILSVIVMSVTPVLNKFSLGFINPVLAMFVNSLFSAIFAICYSLISQRNFGLKWNPYLFISGILNGLGIIFLFSSLNLLSPLVVGFLGRFYVVFSIIIATLIAKEIFKRLEFVLIISAISGAFLFSYKGFEISKYFGITLVLAYAFCFAFGNYLVKICIDKKISTATDSLVTSNFVALVMISIFALFQYNVEIYKVQLVGIGFAAIGSFCSGFVGLILYYEGLKFISFGKANIIRATGPLFVAAFSWYFFPVSLTSYNWIGAIILLISVSLLALYGRSKSKETKNNDQVLLEFKKLPQSFKSVLVLARHNGKWMLVKNRKRAWEFPGGHSEEGETFIQTAQREALEEACIELKDITPTGYYTLPSGHTTVVVTANTSTIHPFSPKFETLKRKTFRKLPQNLSFKDNIYETFLGWMRVNQPAI